MGDGGKWSVRGKGKEGEGEAKVEWTLGKQWGRFRSNGTPRHVLSRRLVLVTPVLVMLAGDWEVSSVVVIADDELMG